MHKGLNGGLLRTKMHFNDKLFALHFDGHFFQQCIIDVAAKTEQNT